MKVLLRNARTGLYRGREGKWVAENEQATEFGTIQNAAQKAREIEPEEVDVVLSYDHPKCELALNPVFCI